MRIRLGKENIYMQSISIFKSSQSFHFAHKEQKDELYETENSI